MHYDLLCLVLITTINIKHICVYIPGLFLLSKYAQVIKKIIFPFIKVEHFNIPLL